MEDIESFVEAGFIFLGIIISLAASAKKAKNKRVANAAKKFSFPAGASEPTVAEHPYTPPQITIRPSMVVTDMPAQVIAPTVHAHVQPDCDTHDTPGSLGVTSSEGKDPCHEPQLTHARSTPETTEVEGGLTFDWSGQNMVKAFVMQEILTRPCQRQAR